MRAQRLISSRRTCQDSRRRRFNLPENAKIDQVEAGMENEVLTVTIPIKEDEKKRDVKAIEISIGEACEIPALANLRIDWKKTPKAHVFKADLPGLKKEEVKIEVEEGRILQISGERSKEQEEKNDKWYHMERSSGKFLRRFWLPKNAKIDQVKASMENGVLTVTIPIEGDEKKLHVKAIEISIKENEKKPDVKTFLDP
uniref:SHSP domain-containing protein n=1 Tax=Fagus sylvatica TaxID=28930 RepID=A0A2N9E194_FAGSY